MIPLDILTGAPTGLLRPNLSIHTANRVLRPIIQTYIVRRPNVLLELVTEGPPTEIFG